ALDDIRVVLRKIGAREPDVGDQLIGRSSGHQHTIAFDLGQVINVRRPAHNAGDFPVRVERGGRLKSILRELEADFRWLYASVDQRVQRKEMGRRILRKHNGFAAQVGDALDGIADYDSIAAIGPIHLLIDARHYAGVLAQSLHEQWDHI